MAKNETVFFTKTPNVAFTVSSGTNTIFTAGADGSKLLMLNANVVGSTPNIQLAINDGVSDLDVSEIIPAVVGDLLASTNFPKDKSGNRYMNLQPGWTVKALVSGGGSVEIAAYGEDY